LIEELGATMVDYKIKISTSTAEEHCYETMKELHEPEFIPGEITCIGAGIGDGFDNMSELQVMKFKEDMQTADAIEWQTAAVDEEHDRIMT
jgi:uncharacterized protein YrzB (UPF0473 family)